MFCYIFTITKKYPLSGPHPQTLPDCELTSALALIDKELLSLMLNSCYGTAHCLAWVLGSKYDIMTLSPLSPIRELSDAI